MNDIRNFTKESNILSIEVLDEYEDMVDLTVEDVHYYYANDMLTHNCGEEINICANLSGDDTWCNAINDGKDIHMESAKKVFGIADKEKRGIVKTCSFLIIY